jgi:hypothetical protein
MSCCKLHKRNPGSAQLLRARIAANEAAAAETVRTITTASIAPLQIICDPLIITGVVYTNGAGSVRLFRAFSADKNSLERRLEEAVLQKAISFVSTAVSHVSDNARCN